MPPETDASKKLEEIEKKREERRAARQKAIDEKMAEERLKLGEIEDEHGILDHDIAAVFSPKDGRMVVVKTPRPTVFQRFQRAANSPKPLTEKDMTDLVYSCLVYPDKVEFEKIVTAAPAMLVTAANVCTRLAGTAAEDAGGK